MGFAQRFILVPLAWAFPVLTDRLLFPWSHWNALVPLTLLRVIAGVRVSVQGAIGPENRIVVMNHQSMVDILLAVKLVPRPLAIIPARRRYEFGIPGVSVYLRLARFPLISQKRKTLREDMEELSAGAERCRRGEATMVIFPEGHRTRDGNIMPFMTRGLTLMLSKAPLPVYCIVGDGMWHMRTLAESLVRTAGSQIQVRIIGPFEPPRAMDEIPAFIESVRERMIATLNDMRSSSAKAASPLLRDAV